MSGTPYTPEDLAYIQGMNICNSAMDTIHAEMRELRYSAHLTEDERDRWRWWAWRLFLAALLGWVAALIGWGAFWAVTG